jgi:hypothetical protein
LLPCFFLSSSPPSFQTSIHSIFFPAFLCVFQQGSQQSAVDPSCRQLNILLLRVDQRFNSNRTFLKCRRHGIFGRKKSVIETRFSLGNR